MDYSLAIPPENLRTSVKIDNSGCGNSTDDVCWFWLESITGCILSSDVDSTSWSYDTIPLAYLFTRKFEPQPEVQVRNIVKYI